MFQEKKRKETTEKTLIKKIAAFWTSLCTLTFYERLELALLVIQIVIALIPYLKVVIPIVCLK